MESEPVLKFETRGRIALITLNRPEVRNALNAELSQAVAEAWQRYNNDEDLWVAILTGAGDQAFCAGLDLKEMAQGGPRTPRASPFLLEGVEVRKPTIAAVNGYALAGGFVLAMNCDLRVAAEHAEFGMPNARVGQTAPYLWYVTRVLPQPVALELVMTGRRISAQRAYQLGFVNQVVPKEKLMDAALDLAEAILECAPLSVRALRELVYRGWTLSKSEGMALAEALDYPVRTSEDRLEGPRAFVERRRPRWQGR
jgi:enoyl-CoA hydratase